MSGIAAICNLDGQPADHLRLARMAAEMAYRGPDGIAHWQQGPVALAHCAMHTDPYAADARQPSTNADGTLALAFDGYVANRGDLRQRLLGLGAQLRNRSDAELVVHAYQTWGEDCPRHIHGEYALILWDEGRRTLYCARDHQGLRPLYYYHNGQRLILASDIAAIIAAMEREPGLDNSFLIQMIAHQWHCSQSTPWQGIHRARAGQWMAWSGGQSRSGEYWPLPEPGSIRYRTDAEYAEHYRYVLAGCVREAACADGAIGVEASGGLDSSGVLAIALGQQKAGQLPASAIQGYALAGPRGSAADETAFIDALAHHLSHPIRKAEMFTPESVWFSRQSQRDRDMPFYPNGAMLIGLYRMMASDGVRVALNGLGGDEWLNGRWDYHRQSLASGDWRQLCRSLAADAESFGTIRAIYLLARFGALPLLGHAIMPLRPAPGRGAKTDFNNQPQLLSDEAFAQLQQGTHDHEAALSRRQGDPRALRLLHNPLNAILLDQAERLRARCGVEGRSPLLSRNFIEFSIMTSNAIRLRGGVQKFVHRAALHEVLPEAITGRQTKADFAIAFDHQAAAACKMVAAGLPDTIESLLGPAARELLAVDKAGATLDGRARWQLWNLNSLAVLSGLKGGTR